MKFTKLRIAGFKTFVDPVEVAIEPGLTGIVGPNGCGKSNLVEALRWVMGETAYKAMRASAMEDVIFSGSGRRPPRNSAEVGVVLDNGDHRAPALFNDADVLEVSRRIERNEGSAYRVNGRDVRARDVQILFADASTGARSPAMVRQGQIGELIAAKPVARRAIIEEAAGISGLHARRREAEIRLKAAETNLARLEDVIGEIAVQLESLTRQARQAARYRALSAEIRASEGLLLVIERRQAADAVAAAESALMAARNGVADVAAVQAHAARDQALASAAMPALRDGEMEAAATLQRLKLEAESAEAEARRARNRMAELDRRLAQIEADRERERRQAEEAADEIERLTIALEDMAAEEAEREDTSAEGQAMLEEAEALLAEAETALSELTSAAAEGAARRAAAMRALADSEGRALRLTRERETAAADLARFEADSDSAEVLEEARIRVEEAIFEQETAEEQALESERAAEAAREAEATARSRRDDTERLATRLETEVRTLVSVLGAGPDRRFPPVLDAITVAPGLEAALAAALGDDLALPTDSAAPAFWSLNPSASADPGLPEGADSLDRYVTAPPELARRLAQVGIVSAVQVERMRPRLKPGQRLVSRDGQLWRWDGVTVSAGAAKGASERLAQRNRLTELSAEATAARAAADSAAPLFRAAESAARNAAGAERLAREAARTCQGRLAKARAALAEAERIAADRSHRRSAIAGLLARLTREAGEAEAIVADARAALQELPEAVSFEAPLAEARGRVSDARAAVVDRRGQLATAMREKALRAERIAMLARDLEVWRGRAGAATDQDRVLAARASEAASERADLEGAPEAAEELRAELIERIAEAEIAHETAADARAEGERRLALADRAAAEAIAAVGEARSGEARAEERLATQRERLSAARAGIGAFLESLPEGESLPDIAPGQPIPDPAAVTARRERLVSERDRLGGVNLRAEEEARETGDRRDRLESERTELAEAIRRLRQGIQTIDSEARGRLAEAFQQVDQRFRELFSHLFSGGVAELTLVDSEDPLEAGLDILARPPGKKPQTLTLLSGGEQALTAMALVFAVFLTNPAPICVLDEVDAPLDDANVERFCTLLDEMTRRTETRFLVITHNPITMARMHRLFGVTMAERGVSRLVSVDLAEADRILAS